MQTTQRVLATLRREWTWGVAIFLGLWLRGFRLLDQVPVDDEWHSIHRVLGSGPGQIALDFGVVDHCIPLTLYLELASASFGVSDLVLRAPSFLAGVALLVVAPLLVRRHLGPRATRLFAALLAISPLLVLYSRFHRPYAIATLLALLALAAIERWWDGGRARHALAYGACAALAGWFLLPALPFVAAPLGVMTLAALRGRLAWSRLALPALAFAGLAALLIGPPLWSHPEALWSKLGTSRPGAESLGRAAAFLAGTPSPWLAAGLATLALFGAWRAARRSPRWLALAGGASVALAAGVLLSAPRYAWLGFVVARYALPALPVGLALAALALDPPGEHRGRRLRSVAAWAVVALLLWSGGVPQTLLDTRAWFPGRLVGALEGRAPRAARVPDFYRELAKAPPGRLSLVEAPWYYSLWNNALPDYERLHRQRTRIGASAGACTDGYWGEIPPGSGFALRGLASLADPDALRREGVDFVVFHADPVAELAHVIDPIDVRATGHPDLRGCVEAFLRSDWPVVYRDASLVVFGAAPVPAP